MLHTEEKKKSLRNNPLLLRNPWEKHMCIQTNDLIQVEILIDDLRSFLDQVCR